MSKVGRPTKLTKEFIEALEKVVKQPNFYIYTDAELVDMVNEEMNGEVISTRAFEAYKAGDRGTNSEYYVEFVRLIKKHLRMAKNNLVKSLSNDEKSWQRFAWLLERKFEDFNKLDKTKNDNDNKHSGEVTITRKVI